MSYIRITHDGKTITTFKRDSHNQWREHPATSSMWRKRDANRRGPGGGQLMDEQRPHRARFYGVGLVDLPNGQVFKVQTQSWQWVGDDEVSETSHSQPIHGRKWDDDRTVRVVYEFPGLSVRHENLAPILDALEAANRDHVSVHALRTGL